MGSEQLVAHVAGDAVERAVGDKVREIHDAEFEHLGARVRLLPGADRLISELKDRGHLVVIASSGSESDTARALDHVPDTALADAVVTGDDVDRGKPATDLLDRAVGLVEGSRAAVVGDSPWDAMAARAGGHLAVGVLTGGFTEQRAHRRRRRAGLRLGGRPSRPHRPDAAGLSRPLRSSARRCPMRRRRGR